VPGAPRRRAARSNGHSWHHVTVQPHKAVGFAALGVTILTSCGGTDRATGRRHLDALDRVVRSDLANVVHVTKAYKNVCADSGPPTDDLTVTAPGSSEPPRAGTSATTFSTRLRIDQNGIARRPSPFFGAGTPSASLTVHTLRAFSASR
jgi:hypothetical protein